MPDLKLIATVTIFIATYAVVAVGKGSGVTAGAEIPDDTDADDSGHTSTAAIVTVG